MSLRHYLFLLVPLAYAPLVQAETPRPNIVFIIADDLGYGDLSCYGQQRFSTPNIDRIASSGVRFTQYYSGHNVCAPSRTVLMSSLHPGHVFIRDNGNAPGYREGQNPVPEGYLVMPLTMKKLGYTLGAFGKWGMGSMTSTGDPLKQGFDHFYGYNCQGKAHNYYPTHLWDNEKHVALNNPDFSAHQALPTGADITAAASYATFTGKEYAPDLIGVQAQKFLRDNRDKPFFLYYPTTVPHLALQVPEDSLAQFVGKFPEEPYDGKRGYLPHRTPRAAYAAMITRMDGDVGRLLDLLKELQLEEQTIVCFTSDNGPLYDKLGGTDTDFFNSNQGMRGRKGDYYEGGFHVPGIIAWPGHIEGGQTSERIVGAEDWFPTLLELAGEKASTPTTIDGISFAPTLRGEPQPPRPFLYRESPGYGGQQTVRVGDWKAIRHNLNPRGNGKGKAGTKAKPKAAAKAVLTSDTKPPTTDDIELFNLADDPHETHDVASQNPDVVAQLSAVMKAQHVTSEKFPIKTLDGVATP